MDTEKGSTDRYRRAMRKAKYRAFWIRVQLWIDGHLKVW